MINPIDWSEYIRNDSIEQPKKSTMSFISQSSENIKQNK